MDLELATVDELVAELLRRSTFRGLILRQRESFKGLPLFEWRWDCRNCDPVEVMAVILPRVAHPELFPDEPTRPPDGQE